MPLTGQAKTDYQKKYMQRYRAKKGDSALSGQKQGFRNAPEYPVVDERDAVRPKLSVRPVTVNVRPVIPGLVRPKGVSDNQWAYIQFKAEQENETK